MKYYALGSVFIKSKVVSYITVETAVIIIFKAVPERDYVFCKFLFAFTSEHCFFSFDQSKILFITSPVVSLG